MRLPERGWIGVIAIILFPLAIEDLSGLVYADQNLFLDHLAAVATLIGLKGLWGLYGKLLSVQDELEP